LRRFWKRDERELARLERQLQAHRSEPPAGLVREIVHEIGSRRHAFTPRLRYAILAGVVVAMVAAAASAGLPSVPTPVTNVSSSTTVSSTADSPSPANKQYHPPCGGPPWAKCTVEVDPDNPTLNPGKSGTTPITFTLTLLGGNTSDGTVQVGCSTTPGTATPGTDYNPTCSPATVTFPMGATTATDTVTVIGHPVTNNKSVTFNVVWTALANDQMDSDDNFDTVTILYKK
jgi:hypothetical protein